MTSSIDPRKGPLTCSPLAVEAAEFLRTLADQIEAGLLAGVAVAAVFPWDATHESISGFDLFDGCSRMRLIGVMEQLKMRVLKE